MNWWNLFRRPPKPPVDDFAGWPVVNQPDPVQPQPPDPSIPTVPDSVMEQFLASCRLSMEAAWGCSDCSSAPSAQNPKAQIAECFQSIHRSMVAAVSADGSDAVMGYALVAQSIARKCLHLRQMGVEVGDSRRPQIGGLPPGWEQLLRDAQG